MNKETFNIREEHISADEYIDFLKRTDLGSQYPKERFEERIPKLVKNVTISLIARNEEGLVVGVRPLLHNRSRVINQPFDSGF